MKIWDSVVYNLGMVAWFMLPLILCRCADICFGAVNAWKDITKTFDWKKILDGVISSAIMVFGLALLVSGVVSLPSIMEYYNFNVVDTDVLSDMINVVIIVTLLIATTVTYGKDAFLKLKTLLGGDKQ